MGEHSCISYRASLSANKDKHSAHGTWAHSETPWHIGAGYLYTKSASAVLVNHRRHKSLHA